LADSFKNKRKRSHVYKA